MKGRAFYYYFLATKRMGRLRLILNVKEFNTRLLIEKFRMETLASILRDFCPGMWMISLNPKDAYLHVTIHPSHWWLLRFVFRDATGILRCYQSTVLLFGLATASRLFTKLLAPVAAPLHTRTMAVFPCIDDNFHAHDSEESAFLTRNASLHLHLQLGLIINLAKSFLVPSQVMTHLGALTDKLKGIFQPTLDKIGKSLRQVASLLEDTSSGWQVLWRLATP